jgi:glycosyltransferase involved in cell wall biosynthesis
VATVSRWSAGEITRLAGVPPERITVVPQGAAPFDAPAPEGAVRQARERHGLGGAYFLAVTGGDRRKGRSFLDDVWKRWAPGAAPELAVVGGAHRHVHGRVGGERGGASPPAGKALGHVSDDDLRALYTGAVALLHPAAAEGFGRPPLEALACGTRVLAAPYGPAREVLGEAADLAPLDAGAWREAIDALLNEPTETRAARLTAGREQAAGWSWDEAVDALLDLCRLQVRDAR